MKPSTSEHRGSVGEAFVRCCSEEFFERWRVYSFEALSSTMDAAARYSDNADSERFSAARVPGARTSVERARGEVGACAVILAEAQSKGRGREGRAWDSQPQSGVYATFIIDPQLLPGQAAAVSLVLGVAVRRMLSGFGIESKLKWPNDVLYPADRGWRKLSGVLVETASAGARLRSLHAGIGVNVSQERFAPDVPGISMRQILGEAPAYADAAAKLACSVDQIIGTYSLMGFSAFLEEWWEGSAMRNAPVTVRGWGGDELKGIVSGLKDDGGLMVTESATGREMVVYSGEVLLS